MSDNLEDQLRKAQGYLRDLIEHADNLTPLKNHNYKKGLSDKASMASAHYHLIKSDVLKFIKDLKGE